MINPHALLSSFLSYSYHQLLSPFFLLPLPHLVFHVIKLAVCMVNFNEIINAFIHIAIIILNSNFLVAIFFMWRLTNSNYYSRRYPSSLVRFDPDLPESPLLQAYCSIRCVILCFSSLSSFREQNAETKAQVLKRWKGRTDLRSYRRLWLANSVRIVGRVRSVIFRRIEFGGLPIRPRWGRSSVIKCSPCMRSSEVSSISR